jgi:hypothetical protein
MYVSELFKSCLMLIYSPLSPYFDDVIPCSLPVAMMENNGSLHPLSAFTLPITIHDVAPLTANAAGSSGSPACCPLDLLSSLPSFHTLGRLRSDLGKRVKILYKRFNEAGKQSCQMTGFLTTSTIHFWLCGHPSAMRNMLKNHSNNVLPGNPG